MYLYDLTIQTTHLELTSHQSSHTHYTQIHLLYKGVPTTTWTQSSWIYYTHTHLLQQVIGTSCRAQPCHASGATQSPCHASGATQSKSLDHPHLHPPETHIKATHIGYVLDKHQQGSVEILGSVDGHAREGVLSKRAISLTKEYQ